MADRIIILFVFIVGVVGCGGQPTNNIEESDSLPSVLGVPFAISIEPYWDENLLYPITQVQPVTCTATDASPDNTNCQFIVPEQFLHFAYVKFTMAVAALDTCKTTEFFPYYYRASTAAGFSPTWDTGQTGIDCSSVPEPDTCYSGPATEIVEGFPYFGSVYFTPNEQVLTSKSWMASSAASKVRYSNRWMVNDMAAAVRGNNQAFAGDGYVGGTMQDWEFKCYDEYMQTKYRILLLVDDENSTTDEWPTWN